MIVKKITSLRQESFVETRERLAFNLLEIGAVQFGNFKLKLHEQSPEAPLSPIYLDLRILRRFPEVKHSAVAVYQSLMRPLRFDLLADVPTAATPLVSSLSDQLGVGMITPRLDVKTHGAGAKVDGLLVSDRGKTVVLIDDLVTRADSKLAAVDVLRKAGVCVNDVVVLIDREQGGRKQLAAQGLTLHAALTINEMLTCYRQQGKINDLHYQEIFQKLSVLNQFLAV